MSNVEDGRTFTESSWMFSEDTTQIPNLLTNCENLMDSRVSGVMRLTLSPYLVFSNMWRLLWTMACISSWFWSAHSLIRVRLDKISGSKFWWCFGMLRNWRSARLIWSWTWILTGRHASPGDGSVLVPQVSGVLTTVLSWLWLHIYIHIYLFVCLFPLRFQPKYQNTCRDL